MVVVPGGEKGCPWQAEVGAGMEGPLPRSSAPAISTEHSHDLRLIFRDTSIRRAWSVLEIGDRRCDEALPLALNPITCLLCLDEFDALPLLRHAGEDRVYLQSQEHHKTRHVEPEHEDYHRPELAVDLTVVT